MHNLKYSIISTFIDSMIIFSVYFFMWRLEKRIYFKLWTISWLFYTLRFVFEFCFDIFPSTIFFSDLSIAASVLSCYFIVSGTLEFQEKKKSRPLIVMTVFNLAWIAACNWLSYGNFAKSLPAFIIFGAAFIWNGFAFIKNPIEKLVWSKVVGIIFIIWGIHKLDYPFVRYLNNENLVASGFILGGMLANAAAVTMIFLYFEKTKKELFLAKEAEEKSHRAKNDFLSNMSHELKTPMNGITGFTSVLMINETDPEKLNMFRMIKISEARLLKMMDDMLEMSRINAGRSQLEISDFDLMEFIDPIVSQFNLLAQSKNIKFNVDLLAGLPQKISTDRQKLYNIITNLLSNSVKFTEKGGVTLAVTFDNCDRPDAGVIIFSVSDSGRGIAEEDRQRIFERFVQGEHYLTKKYGGAGLGLSIVKELTEMLGGEIILKSVQGEGSEFIVKLPYKKTV